MRSLVSLRLLAAACAVAFLGTALPQTASARPGPVQTSFLSAFAYSSQNGDDIDPAGANDWACQPSAAHPRPLVLVHGTIGNRYRNFAYLAPRLKAAGYCVFALDYGDGGGKSVLGDNPTSKGTGDIKISAGELANYVDRVLAATGASQVDFVGHSQGGMLPRAYLRFLPQRAAGKVHRIVGIAPSNHGASFSGFATLLQQFRLIDAATPILGPAFVQQFPGSPFMTELNAEGDTVPGVGYTVIATRNDELVTPYRSAFLAAGPGATVTNITLQYHCPIDGSEHFNIVFSPRTAQLVLNALDPATARRAPCTFRLPIL